MLPARRKRQTSQTVGNERDKKTSRGGIKVVNRVHYRSEEEIVADILSVLTEGTKKTRIMYGANLSYALVTKYTNKLLNLGLITYADREKKYHLSNSGREYLDNYARYKILEETVNTHLTEAKRKKNDLTRLLDERSIPEAGSQSQGAFEKILIQKER